MKKTISATFLRLPHRQYEVAQTLLKSTDVRETLRALARDEEFLFILREASPGFYEEVSPYLKTGDVPERFLPTLYSYVMRFSFRSTPLGLTSSVSLIASEGEANLQADQDAKEVAILRSSSWTLPRDLLILNANCIFKDDFILMTRSVDGDAPLEMKYRVDEKTRALLRCFVAGASKNEVIRSFSGSAPEEIVATKVMIKYWLGEKVLLDVPEGFYPELAPADSRPERISYADYRSRFETRPERVDTYEKLLTRNLPFSVGPEFASLIGKAATAIDRCFSDHHEQALHRRALKRFVRDFSERYGERMIPLNEALSPRIGVGFGDVDDVTDNPELVKYLREKMSAFVLDRKKIWNITTREIEEIAALNSGIRRNRPEGVTVYGSLLEKNGEKFFYLKNTISGLSTLGLSRYNALGICSDDLVRSMIATELPADPGIVYAEIVAHTRAPIRSVRRRKCHFDHAITFNTVSGVEGCREIPFSSLFVFCRNQKIHLYSPELKKIVIPVLNHVQHFMYDHVIQNRFLCALAKQHSPHLNGWYWGKPSGETYWPRVQWDNIILFPKSWTFDKKTFVTYAAHPDFRRANGIPDNVLLVEEGKELLINFAHGDFNKLHFARFLGDEIILYENLWDEFQSPVMVGGVRYVNEVQMSFSAENEPYVPKGLRSPGLSESYPPCEEFLSLHVLVPECFRFEVAQELLPPGEGFFIFYGQNRNLTELRVRIFGEQLLTERLPRLILLLADMKGRGIIHRYSFSDYESDLPLFTSRDTISVLHESHRAHAALIMAGARSGSREADLYWLNFTYAWCAASALDIFTAPGASLVDPLARKIHKTLMKRLHEEEIPQVISEELRRQMGSLPQDGKAMFLSRVIHLNNLRVSAQANFQMDQSTILLIQKEKSRRDT